MTRGQEDKGTRGQEDKRTWQPGLQARKAGGGGGLTWRLAVHGGRDGRGPVGEVGHGVHAGRPSERPEDIAPAFGGRGGGGGGRGCD